MSTQAQRILDQLVVWLEEIQTANGYHTDSGLDVRTEQDRNDVPLEPCLLLLDEDASYNPPASGRRGTWSQTYTIEALVHDDGDGRRLAREVLTDIHRALNRRLTDWPPSAGVSSMRESAREIPRRPSDSDWLTPTVTIDIDFVDKED